VKHRVKTRAVKVYTYNAELKCHTSRIVGYRLVCTCDWRSPVRRSVAETRDDQAAARVHVQ